MHPSTELFMLSPSESIMFQSALEAIELPAWCCDMSSHLVRMNLGYRQITSAECPTIPLAGLITHFHPDDSARLRLLNTNRPQEKVAQLNSFRIRLIGEFKQVETLTIWSFSPNGTTLGNLNIIFTQRMNHSEKLPENNLAQKISSPIPNSSQLIIGELQHRLRNVLMVVSSLAENCVRSSDTLDDFLPDFSRKLNNLIRAHEQICSDRRSGQLFTELASAEIERIVSEPMLVSIKSPIIYIRKELIPIFQLILYELTTNSLKYGAAKSLRGSITLRCSHSVDSRLQPIVEFHWCEHWKPSNGIKRASHTSNSSDSTSGGNGMRLLKTLITKYCKGTFNYNLEAQRLDVSWCLSKHTLYPQRERDFAD